MRRLRLLLTWTALGALLGTMLLVLAPLALGGRSFTMLTGSMSPAIDPGDVVVALPIAPSQARPGDVVTFPDPEGTGKLISHRVLAVGRRSGEYAFVTRGDANTTRERWRVAADGSVGRVAVRLPKLGYALAWTGTPAARILLLALPALALCAIGLVRIWRPEDEPGVPR